MEQEDLWEQFVASGRIADYLKFTSGLHTEAADDLTPDVTETGKGSFPEAALPAGNLPEVTIPGVAVPGETLEEEILRQMSEKEEMKDDI